MTQRSMFAGKNPTVIIKAGASVTVKGWEEDRVQAETDNNWGLQMELRSAAELGRARAAIGDHVLFDIHLKMPNLTGKESAEDVIDIQLGGSGEVLLPFGSTLKIYAGRDIDTQGVTGQVDAYAGFRLHLQNVYCLGNASAGSSMHVDCQTMVVKDVTFSAGSDLRFHVHDLNNARIRIKDLGGYWEAQIGKPEKAVYLKSGGDVTLVTDQKVEPVPPNYILGKIVTPAKE